MEMKPWHRRLDLKEGPQAYHAFWHFRELPLRARAMDRAFTVCRILCGKMVDRTKTPKGKPDLDDLPDPLLEATTTWKEWRRKHLWDERSVQYDAWMEDQDLEERKAAIAAMNVRHADMAHAALDKAMERLGVITAEEMTPRQTIVFMKEASLIERRARGEATDIVKHQQGSASEPLDISKLTDAELTIYLEFMDKMSSGKTE